jgi:hypothetical protein
LHERIDILEKELEKNKIIQNELVNYSKQVTLTMSDIVLELGIVLTYIKEISSEDANILLNSGVYDSFLNKKMFN